MSRSRSVRCAPNPGRWSKPNLKAEVDRTIGAGAFLPRQTSTILDALELRKDAPHQPNDFVDALARLSPDKPLGIRGEERGQRSEILTVNRIGIAGMRLPRQRAEPQGRWLAVQPVGIYYDRFAEEDGRLVFKWRMFQTQYAGPPVLVNDFEQVQDFGAPPAMPPLDAETTDTSGVGDKAARG